MRKKANLRAASSFFIEEPSAHACAEFYICVIVSRRNFHFLAAARSKSHKEFKEKKNLKKLYFNS